MLRSIKNKDNFLAVIDDVCKVLRFDFQHKVLFPDVTKFTNIQLTNIQRYFLIEVH